MKWYLITKLDTGETHFEAGRETDPIPAYDENIYTVRLWPRAPTEQDTATAHLDFTGVEQYALKLIDSKADSFILREGEPLGQQIALVLLWGELQRLKLANSTGNFVNLTPLEKAKQFPTLTALAKESNNSITNSARAIEDKLWDKIQKIATAQAKLLLARDAIKSAQTTDDVLSVVDDINWEE